LSPRPGKAAFSAPLTVARVPAPAGPELEFRPSVWFSVPAAPPWLP